MVVSALSEEGQQVEVGLSILEEYTFGALTWSWSYIF